MSISQISFEGDITAKAAYISDSIDIEKAIEGLQISYPRPAIVLIGGAGGIGFLDQFRMRKAIGIVASLANETQSVVLDGGTGSGIMYEIGQQRKRNKFSFPLIGVVVESLLAKKNPRSRPDPNHTHFFLIPGQARGDESAWISKIATVIARDQKSITILVNGGRISQKDIDHSLLENRPAFVMRGTGRLANEISPTRNIVAVDISKKPKEILEILRAGLL